MLGTSIHRLNSWVGRVSNSLRAQSFTPLRTQMRKREPSNWCNCSNFLSSTEKHLRLSSISTSHSRELRGIEMAFGVQGTDCKEFDCVPRGACAAMIFVQAAMLTRNLFFMPWGILPTSSMNLQAFSCSKVAANKNFP